MQQHIAILESLDVHVCAEMQYRLLVEKLPRDLINKWEDKHPPSSQDYPTFSELAKFVNEAAFRLARDDSTSASHRFENPSKRDYKQGEQQQNKYRKSNQGTRTFVTSTGNQNCIICGASHMLYQCPKFGVLSIPDRWATVRKHNLCRNCLRRHRGDCTLTHCKQCPARHHTLLHNPDFRPRDPRPQSVDSEKAS